MFDRSCSLVPGSRKDTHIDAKQVGPKHDNFSRGSRLKSLLLDGWVCHVVAHYRSQLLREPIFVHSNNITTNASRKSSDVAGIQQEALHAVADMTTIIRPGSSSDSLSADPNSERPDSPSPSDTSTVTLAPFDVPPYNFTNLDTLCDALEAASTSACLEMEETISWRRNKPDPTEPSTASLLPPGSRHERVHAVEVGPDLFLYLSDVDMTVKVEAQAQLAMSNLSRKLELQELSTGRCSTMNMAPFESWSRPGWSKSVGISSQARIGRGRGHGRRRRRGGHNGNSRYRNNDNIT